jgi:1-phosphatidylinositol-3-phosphate 5-kinase
MYKWYKKHLTILVSCDSPLYIRPHAKAVLNKAIEMDTKFLSDNSVMDYSLLVGLEPNTDELVIGIIGKSVDNYTR